MICPYCGTANRPGAKICHHCGKALPQAATPPPNLPPAVGTHRAGSLPPPPPPAPPTPPAAAPATVTPPAAATPLPPKFPPAIQPRPISVSVPHLGDRSAQRRMMGAMVKTSLMALTLMLVGCIAGGALVWTYYERFAAATDFSASRLDGTVTTLSAERNGKAAVIMFWDGQTELKAEFAQLNAVAKEQGVSVVAVSDSPPQTAVAGRYDSITFLVDSKGDARRANGGLALPATILINADGSRRTRLTLAANNIGEAVKSEFGASK